MLPQPRSASSGATGPHRPSSRGSATTTGRPVDAAWTHGPLPWEYCTSSSWRASGALDAMVIGVLPRMIVTEATGCPGITWAARLVTFCTSDSSECSANDVRPSSSNAAWATGSTGGPGGCSGVGLNGSTPVWAQPDAGSCRRGGTTATGWGTPARHGGARRLCDARTAARMVVRSGTALGGDPLRGQSDAGGAELPGRSDHVVVLGAAPASQHAGDRADPGLGLTEAGDERHEVVVDAPERVRDRVDHRVVEHPADPLEAGPQRPDRLLQLLDQLLEPFRGALGRGDRLA